MIMRAKAMLYSMLKRANTDQVDCEFSFVTADDVEENKKFHKYTPCGKLELCIDNPPLVDKLELGKSYYVDFTEAPE